MRTWDWVAVTVLSLTTLLPKPLFAQAGKDPVEDAMEAFDKQVAVAKKQFDGSVERSSQNTIKRLIALADGAARNKNDDFAGRAFKEVLRLDRNNAQARLYFQQRNKLDAVLTQLTLEWEPLVLVAPEARERLALAEERDRALAALKELEFDHRTGKVSDEDYRAQVGPLRRRAADVLRALEGGEQTRHERVADRGQPVP